MPAAHPPLYAALVPPHALAAALAVAAGATALGTRKGGPAHARAGRWYWGAIAGVAASGAALLLAGAWSVRLLVLLALTTQTTWSGVRVLRRRRPDLRAADRASAADWALAVAACGVGLGACAAAAAGVEPRSAAAVWSTAPLLALYAGYDVWLTRGRLAHGRGDAALRAQLADVLARLGAAAPNAAPPSAAPSAPRWAERLVVGLARGARVLATAEVEWVEAADNYVAVHAADGSGLLREPLKSLEARLDPARFARVHRSALVNLARVRELRPLPSGDYMLTMRSGAAVTLSRTYRDAVLARLG